MPDIFIDFAIFFVASFTALTLVRVVWPENAWKKKHDELVREFVEQVKRIDAIEDTEMARYSGILSRLQEFESREFRGDAILSTFRQRIEDVEEGLAALRRDLGEDDVK